MAHLGRVHMMERQEGRSTDLRLSIILKSLHDWRSNLQSCFAADIVYYFDFKKAFDTISYPKLLVKLKAYMAPLALCIINYNEFLHDRSQSVKSGASFSSPVPVIRSVPYLPQEVRLVFLRFIIDIRDILLCNFTM